MKTGLVLAGGGSRGAYQMGVWQALRELSFPIDVVAGTSVGALNAAMVAQGDFDEAMEIWQHLTTADVLDLGGANQDFSTPEGIWRGAKSFMENLGGKDAAPLYDLVRRMVSEKRVRESSVDFGIVTVRFPDFRPTVITKTEMEQGKLVDYILASAACFPAMKSYAIGKEQYIDGGYYNNLPIEIAIKQGARDIIAVDLQALGLIRPVRRPDVRIRTLRCHWDLGPVLTFDPQVSRRNIRLGYLDTLRLFRKVAGRFYSFRPGQLRKIATTLLPYLAPSCQRCSFGIITSRGLPGEEHGKLRLLQALGLRSGQRYEMERFLTRCAETAGEALGLDPLILYEGDTFIDAALRAGREQIRHTADDLAVTQADVLSATAVKMAKQGTPVLASYLADCIWKVFESQVAPHCLWRAAERYPKAFAAGIFLLLCRQLREPRFL